MNGSAVGITLLLSKQCTYLVELEREDLVTGVTDLDEVGHGTAAGVRCGLSQGQQQRRSAMARADNRAGSPTYHLVIR